MWPEDEKGVRGIRGENVRVGVGAAACCLLRAVIAKAYHLWIEASPEVFSLGLEAAEASSWPQRPEQFICGVGGVTSNPEDQGPAACGGNAT